MRVIENSVAAFLGLREQENPLQIKPDADLSLFARVAENLRPVGGMLAKVRGTSLHSYIGYGLATRMSTLLRFLGETGGAEFMGTAWDNLLKYSGSAWAPLLSPGSVPYSDWDLIPSSLLFGDYDPNHANLHYSFVNRPFDWLVYRDMLYLTDGYNRPIKTDGTSAGEWGLRPFTAAGSVLLSVEQNAAGNLQNVAYSYKVALYESASAKEAAYSTGTHTFTPSGVSKKVWVYVSLVEWAKAGQYDWHNEFTDKIRIWRNPAVSGTGQYWLAATLNTGLRASGALTSDLDTGGANDRITDTGASFTTDGIEAGYVAYVADGGGSFDAYQISAVLSDTQLQLLDGDGQAYSGGNYPTGRAYRIFPGFVDNVQDLTASSSRYWQELDADADHSPPERCKYCVFFAERAYMAGDPDNPNRVYYSEIGNPDYWPVDNYQDIDPDDGDRITGLVKFQGTLYVFKRFSAAVWAVGIGDPIEWTVTPRALSVGAEDVRLIKDCDGLLVFANMAGVWRFDGRSLRRISHDEGGSNVRETWDDKVVLADLANGRAEFHEAQGEYWLAVCLDDARGLYDSALAGAGAVLEGSRQRASDAAPVVQNNAALVYRLDSGQWWVRPGCDAAAWAVWRGASDALELYRSAQTGAVLREDNSETNSEPLYSPDAGQESGQATGGSGTTLADTGQAWTPNQWFAARLYKLNYDTGAVEYCTVLSNDATTITGSPGTFNGANNAWTVNPQVDDYYALVLNISNAMAVRWRSPKMAYRSLREAKWLVQVLARVLGNGNLTLAWTADGPGGVGGTETFVLNQGARTWGDYNWGASATATTLLWSALASTLEETDLSADAEGRYFEIELTLTTSQTFELTLLAFGYRINTNGRWRP